MSNHAHSDPPRRPVIQLRISDLLIITVLFAVPLAAARIAGLGPAIGMSLTFLVAFGRLRWGSCAKRVAWKMTWALFAVALFLPTLQIGCVSQAKPVAAPIGLEETEGTSAAEPPARKATFGDSSTNAGSAWRSSGNQPSRLLGWEVAWMTTAAILDGLVKCLEGESEALLGTFYVLSLTITNLALVTAPWLARPSPSKLRGAWIWICSASFPAAWLVLYSFSSESQMSTPAEDLSYTTRVLYGHFVWLAAQFVLLSCAPLTRRHWYLSTACCVMWFATIHLSRG